jgi:hypothetical protein
MLVSVCSDNHFLFFQWAIRVCKASPYNDECLLDFDPISLILRVAKELGACNLILTPQPFIRLIPEIHAKQRRYLAVFREFQWINGAKLRARRHWALIRKFHGMRELMA